MRIVAYDPFLPEYTGGAKHGLALLGVAAERHPVTVLYEQPPHSRPFDPDMLRVRFGIDPGRFEFARVTASWAVPSRAKGADLFVCLNGTRVVETGAARQLAFVTFPERPPPAPTATARLGRAWQRVQERYHARLDALAPDLFDTPTRAYLKRHGAAGAWKSLPLVLARRAGSRAACERYDLSGPALARYTLLAANSGYTAEWLRRFYGLASVVNYPPIDTPRFRRGAKEKLILSVGRFAPEPFSKKFGVLIDAFRQLTESGAAAGWRLVLAGGTSGAPSYEAYLAGLRERAVGLPVEFAVDRPLGELTDLNARASLYWHAMGYGEDRDGHPERFEHFGMTTVEAMAAGCVPMAIAGGGQPEIITPGRDGYLWGTPDELVAAFADFARLPAAEVETLRASAEARAEDFGPDAYRRSTLELYERLGVPVS